MKELLPALMLFLLLCALCLSALAVEVDYIYYTWDEDTRVLTRHKGTCANATPLSYSTSKLSGTRESGGWYVADTQLGYGNIALYVEGDVHLILADG